MMTQTQLPETVNKPPEKTSRDVFISGVAGLLGGPLGAPLSVGSYLLWQKIGLQSAGRWWAWAATGLIGAPLSWVITAAILPHPPAANQASMSSSSETSQLAKPDRAPKKTQENVKVETSQLAKPDQVPEKTQENVKVETSQLAKPNRAPEKIQKNVKVGELQTKTPTPAPALASKEDIKVGELQSKNSTPEAAPVSKAEFSPKSYWAANSDGEVLRQGGKSKGYQLERITIMDKTAGQITPDMAVWKTLQSDTALVFDRNGDCAGIFRGGIMLNGPYKPIPGICAIMGDQ
jgi:hypothetical protein